MKGLNERQKEAVLYNEGPLMVLAGAGSGKTKTLVSKIQYLLEEENLQSYQMMAVTFSNKAAREMRERVASQTGFESASLNITTFHSFCSRLLRREAQFLGLSRNFTIYDDSESLSLIKGILGKRGKEEKEISPKEVKYFISEVKNHGFYHGCEKHPESYGRNEIDFTEDDFYPFYLDYEAELHRSNAVDFGGLIIGVIQLFESFPEVLERYQKRFQYILVDEYQDTNRAQFILLNLLSKLHQNICVVGDEDQSIYSWRGADIRNILDFEHYYKDFKLVKLEQNYRSTQNIIEAASHVISKNAHRKGKEMWTDNEKGEKITLLESKDDRSEADFVGREIAKLEEHGGHFDEMAIFYRSNAQSRQLEDALRVNRIPYRIIAGLKFYERKEVKDLLCYLRLVVNPKDALALSRIINTPARGVGVGSLRRLEEYALTHNLSLWEGLCELVKLVEEGSPWPFRATSKMKSALREFVHIIQTIQYLEREKEETPSFCYKKILEESGYLESLRKEKTKEARSRVENLEELYSAIKQYEETEISPSLLGFLETIVLDSEKEENAEDKGKVSLMTIHGAKGLEYDYVFMTGNEENVFPTFMSIDEGQFQIEEERRLFYVAMTRAMKKLYITYARARMLWGQIKFNPPSRFIDEVPEDYLERVQYQIQEQFSSSQKPKRRHYQDSDIYVDFDDENDLDLEETFYIEDPIFTYQKGETVIHKIYGKGVVVQSEGIGPDEKVTISFPGGVRKKFVVRFAPIEREA